MTPRSKLNILWFSFLILLIFLSTGSTIFIVQHPEAIGSNIYAPWYSEKESHSQISMLLTGDIMLGRYIKTLRSRNGGDYPFTYMPEIIDAVTDSLEVDDLDLIVGNLEGPISDSPYVNSGSAMIFNFDPETADLLKNVGFTTVSQANNHAYDQGTEYYEQSIDYLTEAGVDGFGYPDKPVGEHSFISYEIGGTTVGFLGLNDAVLSLDEDLALEQIAALDAEVDVLIIGIHWGIEYETTARNSIENFAHEMVDAGADFIWGHHPHVIQNSEIYKGVPIYYSLGNFVFDQYFSSTVKEGLVLGLKLDDTDITVTEIMVDLVNQGEPRPRYD